MLNKPAKRNQTTALRFQTGVHYQTSQGPQMHQNKFVTILSLMLRSIWQFDHTQKQNKKTKWKGNNLQVWIHGSKNNAKLHFELHKGFEQRAFDRSGFSEVPLRYLTVGPRDRCEIKYIVKRKLSWLHSCLWFHILPGVLFSAFLLVKSGPGVFVCGRPKGINQHLKDILHKHNNSDLNCLQYLLLYELHPCKLHPCNLKLNGEKKYSVCVCV